MKCKKCNSELEMDNIYDIDGGITDGEFSERQLWHCEECGTEYIIEQIAKVETPEIVYFEEA